MSRSWGKRWAWDERRWSQIPQEMATKMITILQIDIMSSQLMGTKQKLAPPKLAWHPEHYNIICLAGFSSGFSGNDVATESSCILWPMNSWNILQGRQGPGFSGNIFFFKNLNLKKCLTFSPHFQAKTSCRIIFSHYFQNDPKQLQWPRDRILRIQWSVFCVPKRRTKIFAKEKMPGGGEETRRRGDEETRRRGDKETRRQGEQHTLHLLATIHRHVRSPSMQGLGRDLAGTWQGPGRDSV